MSLSSGRHRTLNLSKVIGGDGTPCKYSEGLTKKVLRFQLPHNSRVKDIIEKFISGENIREYGQLVCSIRDNVFQDAEIIALLKEATQCISLLNQDLHLFVEAILTLKWTQKSDTSVNEYRSFLVNLLCAHNYHTKLAMDQLVLNFMPGANDKEWVNGIPNDEDCKRFANVHSVINILLKVIPMSREILQQSITAYYPYLKKPAHQHETYIHNILWILDYQPEFRLDFFFLIFNRLIVLDVNAPRDEILKAEEDQLDDEIFSMEDDESTTKTLVDPDKTKHPIAYTLDICLDKIMNFFIAECHDLQTGQLDWDKTKSLYHTMIAVFDKVILPTYNIHHVQYIMFFLCSFKVTISEAFLTYLWKKVCDPNVASIHRQAAVGYIASLLARASFIPLSMLKSTLQHMASWIHSYISTQDGLECVNSDVRVHAVFYSICQGLFYVVAFRYRDLVNTKKNITFLESLNLGKMVTSRLNPLRVCQPAILQNFAAVTRTYQLAYCYSIIEHNARNIIATVYMDEKGSMSTSSSVLDAFFPFDPFLIKRCGEKLTGIYLEYNSSDDDTGESSNKMEEDDDFLNDQSFNSGIASPRNTTNKFSYGTSPGFKYKSNS